MCKFLSFLICFLNNLRFFVELKVVSGLLLFVVNIFVFDGEVNVLMVSGCVM